MYLYNMDICTYSHKHVYIYIYTYANIDVCIHIAYKPFLLTSPGYIVTWVFRTFREAAQCLRCGVYRFGV